MLRTSTGTLLFGADNGGTAVWTLSGGRFSLVWHNGNGGTSPVVAGGLLYVYDANGGALRVYQPATSAVVATLPCGTGHWNSPIMIDGRIALPQGSADDHRTTGILDIWRRP